MINDAQDDNVVIDMMNDSPAPNPLDEFEEEDDNDFLNEPEKEEQPSPFIEDQIQQQQDTLVDDFQVREENPGAVNNDTIIDSSREKMLFDKLGNYLSLVLPISVGSWILILSFMIIHDFLFISIYTLRFTIPHFTKWKLVSTILSSPNINLTIV